MIAGQVYHTYFSYTIPQPIAFFYIDYLQNNSVLTRIQSDIKDSILNNIEANADGVLTLGKIGDDKSIIEEKKKLDLSHHFFILEIPTNNFFAKDKKKILVQQGNDIYIYQAINGDAVRLRTDILHNIPSLLPPHDITNIYRYYYIGFAYINPITHRLRVINEALDKMLYIFSITNSICNNTMGEKGVCISKLAFVSKTDRDTYVTPLYNVTGQPGQSRQLRQLGGSKNFTRKKNNAEYLQGKKYTKKTNIKQTMLYYQTGGALPLIGSNNVFDIYRIEIQNKVYTNNTIIITAGTGLGKTTRVPIYLLEILTQPGRDKELFVRTIAPQVPPSSNWLISNPNALMIPEIEENSMILCALPKVTLVHTNTNSSSIVTAIANNINVTDTNECNKYKEQRIIGGLLASTSSNQSRSGKYLNFITSGFLLKKMESDPNLENFMINRQKYKISCVIIDEAHERTSEIDLLLIQMKRLLLVRPNFKLVIMSATINACIFKEYFYGEKVLYGPEPGVICDNQNNSTFAQYYEKHANSEVPILHIDSDSAKSWTITRVVTPYPPRDVNTFNVEIYYLPPATSTCYNLIRVAQLILEIVSYEKSLVGFTINKPHLSGWVDDNGIRHNISDILRPATNITLDQDIIVFVPEKNIAKIIWSYLYLLNVQEHYDVIFYSKGEKIRLGKNAYLNMEFNGDTINQAIIKVELPQRIHKDTKEIINRGNDNNINHQREDNNAMPMIIFATNVVESSVTFHHMKYVIDLGTNKQSDYVCGMNMDTLSIQCINKASADQRKGRTGRRCNGYCFRLYTKEMYDNFKASKESDLLHNSLDSIFLGLLEKYNFLNLDYIETPSQYQIEVTLTRLKIMGFIRDGFDIYSRHDNEDYVNIEMIEWYSNLKPFLKFNRAEGQDKEYIDLDMTLLSILYSVKDNIQVDDIIFIIFAMFMIQYVTKNPGSIGQSFTPPKTNNFASECRSCTLLWLYNNLATIYPKYIANEWNEYYRNTIPLQEQLHSQISAPTPPSPPSPIQISDYFFNEMNSKLQAVGQVCGFGNIEVKSSSSSSSIPHYLYFDPIIPPDSNPDARYTYLYSHYSTVFNFYFLTKIT